MMSLSAGRHSRFRGNDGNEAVEGNSANAMKADI
jgi:hypothetical protein